MTVNQLCAKPMSTDNQNQNQPQATALNDIRLTIVRN